VWAWGNGHNGRTGLGHERIATAPVGPLRRGAFAVEGSGSGGEGECAGVEAGAGTGAAVVGAAAAAARVYTSKEHSLVLMRTGRLVGRCRLTL